MIWVKRIGFPFRIADFSFSSLLGFGFFSFLSPICFQNSLVFLSNDIKADRWMDWYLFGLF